jgi:Tetratricopeptide repeat/Rhomboid family
LVLDFRYIYRAGFGHLRTAILITILAVGSGALEFALASGGVGLSGVGYGLFGMLWVLSSYDERFRDAIDRRTVKLFIGWFLFCVFTTLVKWFPVGNIAHAGGAVLGALVGIASTRNGKRTLAAGLILVLVLFGLWGSTFGRPRINFSAQGGYEEGKWGYDALAAGRNQEASHWLKDAVLYQPKLAVYWFNLGIAYQRLGQAKEARNAYQRAQQLEPSKTEYANAVNACP